MILYEGFFTIEMTITQLSLYKNFKNCAVPSANQQDQKSETYTYANVLYYIQILNADVLLIVRREDGWVVRMSCLLDVARLDCPRTLCLGSVFLIRSVRS